MMQLVLLSSDDKLFASVQSAPMNYSGSVAMLLCYVTGSEVHLITAF
jgi:hypothetical protein